MIHKTLSGLAQLLNNYLKLSFKLTEDIAFLYPVKDFGNALPANKICISLVNVERETGGGIRFKYKTPDSDYSHKTAPPWQLNIYILITAVFSEKQYTESLHFFSGILSFIQKSNRLSVPDSGTPVSIEPVNLSFQELSNIWSICGGSYHPSILCKIRVLSVDEQEVSAVLPNIGKTELLNEKQSSI